MEGVKSVTVRQADGETYTLSVTPKRKTWAMHALRHVRELEDAGVLPGGHGTGDLRQSMSALMADGTTRDVTAVFIDDGWTAWLRADYDTTEDHVPKWQAARLRRARAFWAMPEVMGVDPDAEAEYDASCDAERAEMSRVAAATCPHGPAPDLNPGSSGSTAAPSTVATSPPPA